MKTALVVIFASMFSLACNQTTSPEVMPLAISFTLADTTGAAISQTHVGENFVLSFSLINTTPDTLTYGWANSGPPVEFHILQNDSTVATSVDGYVFLMYAPHATLPPGDTLRGRWVAPTTPVQSPKVVLAPGMYQARVFLPYFYEIKVDSIPSISFVVVP